MTLVIDCRMINMSGIGTYLKNIVPGIIFSGQFSVTCLGYEELKDFYWFQFIKYIPVQSKILSLSEQIELATKIPKCDIFWSPNWNIPLLPIKAKKRVVTIHDVYHLANLSNFSFFKISIIKTYMDFIRKTSAKIITVSKFSKNEIEKYTKILPDKIKYIPLAVDVNFNDNFIVPKTIIADYALFVGNVKPHKNLKICLHALTLIEDKNLKFYIVGKKEGFITNDNTLNEYVNLLGERIVFTGQVSDTELKSYYKNARFFLFPSIYEGFGLPILEAMKFKLPIIASKSASIPEVGGNKIIYFDPFSVKDLVDKINKLIKGEIFCSIDGYQEQLNKFDWKVTIAKHVETLKEILQ